MGGRGRDDKPPRRNSIGRTIGKGFSAIGLSKKKLMAKAKGVAAAAGSGSAAAQQPARPSAVEENKDREYYIRLIGSKQLTPKDCCKALALARQAPPSDGGGSADSPLDDMKIVVACALDFFDSSDVQLHAARYVAFATTEEEGMAAEEAAARRGKALRLCGPEVPGVPFLCFSVKKNADDKEHVALVVERLVALVRASPNLFMLELPQYAEALLKRVRLNFLPGEAASRHIAELIATINAKNTGPDKV